MVCNTTSLKQKSEDDQFTYLYTDSCGLSAQVRPLSCEQCHHENQGTSQAANNRLINLLQFASHPTSLNMPNRHHHCLLKYWLLVVQMNNLTRSQRLHGLLQKHPFQTLEGCHALITMFFGPIKNHSYVKNSFYSHFRIKLWKITPFTVKPE